MSVRLAQLAQLILRLDAAVFADAQEDDAVNGHLDGVIELAFVDHLRVAQGDVAGQQSAPVLDILQEGIVHLGGAFLGGLYRRRTGRRSLSRRHRARRWRRFRPIFRRTRVYLMNITRAVAALSEGLGLLRQS